MKRFFYLIYIIISISSCKFNTQNVKPKSIDSTFFSVRFSPSFDESSKILLTKIDSNIDLQILIYNNYRIDKNEDTFYYKKINLVYNQFMQLDSSFIQKIELKKKDSLRAGRDGIEIKFELKKRIIF